MRPLHLLQAACVQLVGTIEVPLWPSFICMPQFVRQQGGDVALNAAQARATLLALRRQRVRFGMLRVAPVMMTNGVSIIATLRSLR